MLPPSFLILPGCCPAHHPPLSPVPLWDRRRLSPPPPPHVIAPQECSGSGADSDQGFSSAVDKKAFSSGHGGRGHISGAAPPCL